MGQHPLHNGSGLMRAWRAARCSLQGLAAAWKNESAFRQEVGLAVLFIPLGVWLGDGLTQQLVLVSSVVIVLIVELLNSAIEAAIDRMGDDYHELSGRAKDLGSAAVFLALLLAGGCYAAALWQQFLQ